MNHNKIDYIEFPAKDLEIIKDFYSTVFDWEFTDYGPDYTSFEDSRLMGGFYKENNAVGKSPLIVIYSNKLDNTKRNIVDNGGEIIRDTFEFPGGKRFHFTDPSGNELAVWTDK